MAQFDEWYHWGSSDPKCGGGGGGGGKGYSDIFIYT